MLHVLPPIQEPQHPERQSQHAQLAVQPMLANPEGATDLGLINDWPEIEGRGQGTQHVHVI